MSDKKAQLTLDGRDNPIDLPIYEGSTGPDVIDVRSLVSEGIFTYDPGFVSTAACDSDITFIDGNKGILLHRGIPYRTVSRKIQFFRSLLFITKWRATKSLRISLL